MARLGYRNDLGIHGEMCFDEILALIEAVRRQMAWQPMENPIGEWLR
jgi:hypothetical protein